MNSDFSGRTRLG